jgi:tripartite-type tricarboxylate transporter receptor subunit TctC
MKLFLILCFTVVNLVGNMVQANNTIRLIVPFSPGSSVDNTARAIEKTLMKELNLNAVVEYKLGAGGNVAAEYVINDTGKDPILLVTSSSVAINVANRTSTVNLDQDLIPVAYVGTIAQVLVSSNQFAYKNLRDWSRIPNSTVITYASGGVGTGNHLSADFLKNVTKKDLVHVPYKGASAMIPDLVGGRVDIAFDFAPTAQQFIRSGRLTALAVVADSRVPELPEVPTFAELGFSNFGFETWYMVFANRRADPAQVARIQQTLARVLADPEKSRPFREAGLQFTGSDTLAAREIVAKSVKKYQDYFKRYGHLQ